MAGESPAAWRPAQQLKGPCGPCSALTRSEALKGGRAHHCRYSNTVCVPVRSGEGNTLARPSSCFGTSLWVASQPSICLRPHWCPDRPQAQMLLPTLHVVISPLCSCSGIQHLLGKQSPEGGCLLESSILLLVGPLILSVTVHAFSCHASCIRPDSRSTAPEVIVVLGSSDLGDRPLLLAGEVAGAESGHLFQLELQGRCEVVPLHQSTLTPWCWLSDQTGNAGKCMHHCLHGSQQPGTCLQLQSLACNSQ